MQKIIAIIIVLAALGAGFYYFSNRANGPESAGDTVIDKNDGATTDKGAMMEDKTGKSAVTDSEKAMEKKMEAVIITVGTEGKFTPDPVKIKVGQTVTWKNTSDKFIWPASAIHPTHQIYPEFDPKKGVAPGEEWSFVFSKVGTWKYHDHLRTSVFGTINVTE
ncbi:MAG: hypothetical protein AAB930_03530 [Patescibacteria group bacterium]